MTKIQTTPLHFLSADLTKESGRGRMRAGGKEGGGLRTPTSTSSHDNPHQCHKCSLHSSKQQTNNMWQHLGECMLLDTKSRPPFLSGLGGDRKWRIWSAGDRPADWLGVGPLKEIAHLRVTPVIQTLWPRHQHLHLLCTVFVDGRQRHEWTRQTFSDVTWFPVHMFCYLSSITVLNSHDLQKKRKEETLGLVKATISKQKSIGKEVLILFFII